ncbi:MAG: hypothetical protein IKG89_06850 [Oscillospiraceae bacterium]|nr:hypothetical protein [Oscillospiraceae bacterium]
MASGINELIDQLDTLIKDAWSLPLSTEKCILDRNNALALLEEIKNQLPAEVTEAKRLISGKAEFIRQTREEVEQMRQEAGDECRRMVEKENVVQEARKRAREIITAAESKANDLRDASSSYADDLLRRTEESIVESLTAIRQSRSSFRDASNRENK